MKKVLFIGSHLSNIRGTTGVSEQIANLIRNHFDILLVSSKENRIWRLLDILIAVLLRRYDTAHIDVFSNRAFIYADISSRIAKIRKKKMIMTLHGGMLPERYRQNPARMKKVFSRADILQSPSRYLIDFFENENIHVGYMPNFIDLSKFPYGRDRVRHHTLLWVRAFSPEYRPELAIETLHRLLEHFPDTTLTMVGPDKGILNRAKKLVTELGLEEKVRFTGSVPNEELYRYYQTHHVYLNTTAYESFGVAVLEAAACGIPVVSTRVGEMPYIWDDGREILLCDADPTEMARQAASIFRQPQLEESLSHSARMRAEEFDWKRIRERWLNILTEERRDVAR